MLDYQVKYWANQETRRANLANEALKAESNKIAAQDASTRAKQLAISERQLDLSDRQLDISDYTARQQAITNKYNAQTQRALTKSNILSNAYHNVLTQSQTKQTVADTKLKESQKRLSDANVAKVPIEAAKTKAEADKLKVEMALKPTETTADISKKYSETYRNVVTPTVELFKGLVELVPF